MLFTLEEHSGSSGDGMGLAKVVQTRSPGI